MAIKWGTVFGVAVLLWTAVLHLLGFYTVDLESGRRADIVAVVIPVAVLDLALRERRDLDAGGRLPVSRAFGTGLLVGLVSVPIAAGGLWVYHHHVNPARLDLVVAHERVRLVATGTPAAAVAARVDQLRAGGTDAAQFRGALVGTALLSLVLSLPLALLLRWRARGRVTHPA